MGAKSAKPVDASDVTDLETAKKEIASLRAIVSLGLNNLLLLTDSYKVSHWVQYPENSATVYSYFESRGGKHKEIVFFGLQYFLKRYLAGVVVTEAKINEAEMIYKAHFGPSSSFPRDKWMYIVKNHGGKLPISIKAVPEGTVVTYKNVLMTVENTDPECFWLTNYLETLLVQVWYPMTVATNSRAQKKVILDYLQDTAVKTPQGDYGEGFKLHDFGFRGVSSVETAGLGAAAHLINFLGTDTIAGLVIARDFYGAGGGEKPGAIAGFSIPASEHSTITSWGKEGEYNAFKNMLTSFPKGTVACVSDSYDIINACTDKMWGSPELKKLILGRQPDGPLAGRLVVRPDSGIPKDIDLAILEELGKSIGRTKNAKGYWELDPHVRIIQGDGIKYETLIEILEHLKQHGWSAENIAFGSGGGLLQKMDRDTQKCAFKCSHLTFKDGSTRNVYKDPVTDKGKRSKKGRLTLHKIDTAGSQVTDFLKADTDESKYIKTTCDSSGGWVTMQFGKGDPTTDALVEVFRDGVITAEYTFDSIRQRASVPYRAEPAESSDVSAEASSAAAV